LTLCFLKIDEVSNAGGLGSLPCAMLGLEAIRNELATAQLTRELAADL
jgi:hypothetical protein